MKPLLTEDLLLTGSQRKRLEAVYCKSEYRVVVGGATLVFKIGQYDPGAERQLFSQLGKQSEWSILTPCNPRSQEATQEMNNFYYQELSDVLASRHSQWLPAINHDPQGSWPDEPGFAIADTDLVWVRELGLRFKQNAYVSAKAGEALRLIWLA